MVKLLDMIKASNSEYLVINFLVLYWKMKMESHLGLMLEQRWALLMDHMIVLKMKNFRNCYLEDH